MKKLLMFVLALSLTVGLWAQNDRGVVTTVFKTDITCEHCAKKIMDNVPSLGKGIKDVKVDVKSKEVSVTYDTKKNSDANIVKGFASIKVKAEPKPTAPKK